MKSGEEYRILITVQRALLADILNPNTTAKDRATIARAIVEVFDFKRIMRMRPKPRDINVSTWRAPKSIPDQSLIEYSKPLSVQADVNHH